MEEEDVFILDICRTRTGVDLWELERGRISCRHEQLTPEFMFSLPDPHRYYQLLDSLEAEYPVEPCTITTIYGEEKGYHVQAERDVALRIEECTLYQARLFNLDIRPEQRYCALTGQVPGGWHGMDRFLPKTSTTFTTMEIACSTNPHRTDHPGEIWLHAGDRTRVLEGPERSLLDDLFDLVSCYDPDVVFFPDYDTWSGIFAEKVKKYGLSNTLSRNGRFHRISPRSYFSYGRMEHRLGAYIPQGRIVIDTRQSFMSREGDLQGIFLASRLSGLSPNLTSRLTPGTLVSSYEVYEALARKLAVPFRKSDAEALRRVKDMRLDYRGGYIMQPVPGVYSDVAQLDFTSFYPSIIVAYNLSPETLNNPDKRGFLPTVLDPLLTLRRATKAGKKNDPSLAGMDGILKWMLVTCFGYTGYKNARFGRIEVHERITLESTRILKDCIAMVRERGGDVIHAIIDCLFITGIPVDPIKEEIENFTGFHTEYELFDWVAILPQADGSGSYGSYFGRYTGGGVKIKGISAGRKDVPAYVSGMQEKMIHLLGTCKMTHEFPEVRDEINRIYHEYRNGIIHADLKDLVITRRIGRERYASRCMAQAVLDRYRECGVEIRPGMDASYLVRDEARHIVDPSWEPQGVDTRYYQRLIDKAYQEVSVAIR